MSREPYVPGSSPDCDISLYCRFHFLKRVLLSVCDSVNDKTFILWNI